MTTTGTPQSGELRLQAALYALTAVTGLVDAASYLGLGRVFTALMTGNVVFLGFGIARADRLPVAPSIAALGAFLTGALLGGRLLARGLNTARLRRSLLLGTALLAAAALVAAGTEASRGPARYVVIAVLAVSMGVQSATVRHLARADLTTTVLTLTLTGLAADSTLAGGTNPRVPRRLGSVATMLAGALTGALLLRIGLAWPLVAAALLGIVAIVLARVPDHG